MKWIQFRHLLHECAEPSGHEWMTRECLKHELKHHAGHMILCADTPSLMMFYDFNAEKTVMLRAEMDGLCIQEETGLIYASKRKDVMHACGHDGHMTILCAVSKRLSQISAFPVNVLLLFQSSEETGAGAVNILNDKSFQKICPDVCCALHVLPQMKKGFYTKKGVICAGGRELDLSVSAEAAHCALRKEDALIKAVHFLEQLSSISLKDGFASFHVMNAGKVRNQGAEKCNLKGTMRFMSHQTERQLLSWLDKHLPYRGKLEVSEGYPVLHNSSKAAELAFACGCQMLKEPLWICDDFSFYAQRIPSVYVLMGMDSPVPLHHACFDFDDRCLSDGIEFLMKFLKECQKM